MEIVIWVLSAATFLLFLGYQGANLKIRQLVEKCNDQADHIRSSKEPKLVKIVVDAPTADEIAEEKQLDQEQLEQQKEIQDLLRNEAVEEPATEAVAAETATEPTTDQEQTEPRVVKKRIYACLDDPEIKEMMIKQFDKKHGAGQYTLELVDTKDNVNNYLVTWTEPQGIDFHLKFTNQAGEWKEINTNTSKDNELYKFLKLSILQLYQRDERYLPELANDETAGGVWTFEMLGENFFTSLKVMQRQYDYPDVPEIQNLCDAITNLVRSAATNKESYGGVAVHSVGDAGAIAIAGQSLREATEEHNEE